MGTYLRLTTISKKETDINALNKDWLDRAADLILPEATSNDTIGHKIGPMITFLTRKEIRDWAIGLRDEPTKRFGFTGEETTKQAIQKVKDNFPSEVILGNCEIKLSGNHYCYHVMARIKGFLEVHRNEINVTGWTDLNEYIGYYNMIDTTYYCSGCVSMAEMVGVQLPLPKKVNYTILQHQINIANAMKEFI